MDKVLGSQSLENKPFRLASTCLVNEAAKAPGRPLFAGLLSRIQQGEANGIACWQHDRLARTPIDGARISWMLQQGIIQHIQTNQRSDYPTDNVLMMSLGVGMANQRQKLAEGWWPHNPPLGYLNNRF